MDYTKISKYENYVSILLQIESEKVFNIGEKMNGINELAYMNGYNWEIFIEHYLAKNSPELLDGLDFDSEAGLFCAFYNISSENDVELKATKLKELIDKLIENEDSIYTYIKENGEDIEWD